MWLNFQPNKKAVGSSTRNDVKHGRKRLYGITLFGFFDITGLSVGLGPISEVKVISFAKQKCAFQAS